MTLSQAGTVNGAINGGGCSTHVVAGLATQIVGEINKLKPGLFSSYAGINGFRFSSAAAAVPFLQTKALSALITAQKDRNTTMTINSALRSIPQQLMLYRWYKAGKCGIPLAAPANKSNHASGLAVDIASPDAWQTAMTKQSWKRLGARDPPHYTYNGGTDIRNLAVKAFQILWNNNNPSNKISADGLYGPATEGAILASPTNGW
eukprot:TRINITY_DN9212_c0_g1_i1.p1 TRINITY_DN9212_c0_g1~~TRINITY_DN9212_c0_g1_i1.p1  ORF type:complete len:230 (+),score=56.22 TRINITY_DN9212_c0_g1_i1:78-692(+)